MFFRYFYNHIIFSYLVGQSVQKSTSKSSLFSCNFGFKSASSTFWFQSCKNHCVLILSCASLICSFNIVSS